MEIIQLRDVCRRGKVGTEGESGLSCGSLSWTGVSLNSIKRTLKTKGYFRQSSDT